MTLFGNQSFDSSADTVVRMRGFDDAVHAEVRKALQKERPAGAAATGLKDVREVVTVASRESEIAPSIVNHWFELSRSQLPDRVFTALVAAAGARIKARGVGARELSGEALTTFLDLWSKVREFCAEPVVSVSPKGDVIAEWFSTPDDSLVIMAGRDKVVHFSLFDEGAPIEGWVTGDRAAILVARLTAGARNPFQWSDADEN